MFSDSNFYCHSFSLVLCSLLGSQRDKGFKIEDSHTHSSEKYDVIQKEIIW
jgi:hypothetical protein